MALDITLSIIIPVRNSFAYFKKCFDSIIRNTNVGFEIIIVDDKSSDKVKSFIQGFQSKEFTEELLDTNRFLQRVTGVQNAKQKGFPVSCNIGIKHSIGRYVVIATSDTIATAEWAIRMIDILESNNLGALGPMTSHCHGVQLIQEWQKDKELVKIDTIECRAADLWKEKGEEITLIGELTGFFILFRKDSLMQLHIDDNHYFDPGYGLGSGEDLDICRRLNLMGHRVAYANGIYIHHFGHKTFSNEPIDTKKLWGDNFIRFKKKFEKREQENVQQDMVQTQKVITPPPIKKKKHIPIMGKPVVDIIFIRYNCEDVENEAIMSVVNYTERIKYNFRIFDNYETGLSLSQLWNKAILESQCEYVCLLNSDIVIQDSLWLAKLVDSLDKDKKMAIVGPSTNNARSKKQSGHRYNDARKMGDGTEHVSELSGFCIVLRKSIWEKLGRFDEKNFPLYGQESDFVARSLKNNYIVGYRRNAFVFHYGAVSATKAESEGKINVEEERAKARKKYKELHG